MGRKREGKDTGKGREWKGEMKEGQRWGHEKKKKMERTGKGTE